MFINFKELGNSGSGSGVTPQQVEEQIQSALTPYWDSAATEDAISAATSGKADAANVTPYSNRTLFPTWNSQGIITGVYEEARDKTVKVNGSIFHFYTSEGFNLPNIYSPQSAGNAGDILVSTGNGAPVWSAVTMPDMSGYWTSAETQSAITEVYDSATTHIDEVEQVMSSALNEFHTQIMDLSGETQGLKSNFGFISGRVQTNEEVLALAVNNIDGIKGELSAYTPTSGFSTINGSAITNGGNLVIEGGGDNTKLLSVAELPATAETGTVMAAVQNFGYWCGNTFYLLDYKNNTKQQRVNIASCDYNGQNFSLYLTWDGKGCFKTGPIGNIDLDKTDHNSSSMWLPYRETWDATNHTLTITSPRGLTAETINISATCVFQYTGSGWTSINNIPLATQNTPGLVKPGQNVSIGSEGDINVNVGEVELSNQTKSVLVNLEADRNDPGAYEPGTVLNIPFFSLSASASFKSSELVDFYGEQIDMELFGTTYAPNQEEPHLHLYYNKAEEQDPYYTFDDLEETGDMPRFDLVDGTSAFTFAVTGEEDENVYTYTANVTVANGDDISVVITIHNESEDKDAEVDIWSGEIEMGAPITLNGDPDIALAKFGREFDPDLGDAVQKWSKYYNEDNIGEAGLVKNEGGVSGIWKGTQAQYDTLTQSGATANPNTFYIIIPSA